MERMHLISRLATSCLFVVLLLLATGSMWIAILNEQAVNKVESSIQLSSLYRQALYEVTLERAAQYEYVLRPSPGLLQEHQVAAQALTGILYTLQRSGESADVSIATYILSEQTHYQQVITQFFAAVDTHDLIRARAIHYQSIDSVFDRIQQQLQVQVNAEQAQVTRNLAQLAQIRHLTFMLTPIMFAIGLALVTLCWWVTRRYRQQLDQAAQSEIARLAQLVLTDPLTGLGNHYAYQECLSQTVEAAQGEGSMLTLVLLDVDEFNIYNNEQGYQQGDALLHIIGMLLREAHPAARLFRLGGDNFALLLTKTPLTETVDALEHWQWTLQRRQLGITVSLGVADAHADELDRELLPAQAMAALQEAKRRGRNRLVSFEEIRESVSMISSTQILALRRLLSGNQIAVAFQPIWDLQTGRAQAFEALARPTIDSGFDGPQELFDVAERIGRAHELDALCVRAILARAAELPADTLLFINLTPQTLVHDLLTGATLLEAVISAGLVPSRVVLEITERSIVGLAEIIQKVKFLRLMGFRVALDDAGAGNAGLEMLSQLAVDFVKIDRAVVSRALTDLAAHSVLVGIMTIARQSHIAVVTEGIETPEMLALVTQLQGQYAQGYLLGRPSTTIPDKSALQALSPLQYMSSGDRAAEAEKEIALNMRED